MSTPRYEQTYGNPPYHETAFKAALRSALSNFGTGLQGLSAVPRGANFGTAFLAALGGSSRAVTQAQQAAQQYAQRQQEFELRTDMARTLQTLQEAQAKKAIHDAETPEKPPKLEPYQLPPEEQAALIEFERRKAEALQSTKPKTGGAAGEMPSLSDEALNAAAQRYALTGVMPSMGMGKQAAAYRAEIMNRAGKKFPAANIAANLADYKKDSSSLTKVQNVRDISAAWEGTVIANGQVMLEAAKHIPEFGNMPMNYIARHGETILGSARMAAFNTARETLKNEAARLLNQPGGTGGQVLSDASRKEIERIVSGNLTGNQLRASFNILRRDAMNKRTSYDRQVKEIQGRLRNNPIGATSTLPTAPQQGTQSWIYDPDTGEMVPAQ